jgi:hypothetical protein
MNRILLILGAFILLAFIATLLQQDRNHQVQSNREKDLSQYKRRPERVVQKRTVAATAAAARNKTFSDTSCKVLQAFLETLDTHKDTIFKEPAPQTNRVLWMYWDTTVVPPLIARNLARTQHVMGASWTVQCLNRSSFSKLCGNDLHPRFNTLDGTKQSDFARLWLLGSFGGVYMDASVILNKSLDDFVADTTNQRCELGALCACDASRGGLFPSIESFLLIAPQPHSPLLLAWLAEFTFALDVGLEEHRLRALQQGFELHAQGRCAYFGVYHALQVVLQASCTPKRTISGQPCLQHKPRILLRNADTTAYRFQTECSWDAACLQRILRSKRAFECDMLKLTGSQRKMLPLSFFDTSQ